MQRVRYTPFFCPRIFTDFHELAAGLPGFSVQNSRLFVNWKKYSKSLSYSSIVTLNP